MEENTQQPLKNVLKQRLDRFERIHIEDEALRAGFAAFPYLVMNDTDLSVGARFTYAMLLQFAWQEGSTFAKQETLAEKIGVSLSTVKRYLYELRDTGYISIDRKDRRYNNTYTLKKLSPKLKKRPKPKYPQSRGDSS